MLFKKLIYLYSNAIAVELPELVKQQKDNLFISVITNITIALVAVILLWESITEYLLFMWLFIHIILSILRILTVNRLFLAISQSQQYKSIKLWYMLIMMLTGLNWGAVAIMAALYSSVTTQLLITLLITGLISGSISTLTPVFVASPLILQEHFLFFLLLY